MDRKSTETAHRGAGSGPFGSSPKGLISSRPSGGGGYGPLVGFIGAGVVGKALALALHRAGYPVVAAASRRLSSAQALAGPIDGCQACPEPQAVVDAAELVFIAVPDDAIGAVVEALAWRPGQMVVHTSGASSTDILSPASMIGALVGSFHPLQTFAGVEEALASLPGTTFALEGDPELLAVLQGMAEALRGRWLVLSPGDKALYHAAAVLVSNYTVALVDAACQLWQQLGVEPAQAVGALLPLLKGTVSNIERLGLPQCLTGPIARGDVDTVRRHLSALAERASALLPLYRELGLLTIPLGLAKGSLSREAAERLLRFLQDKGGWLPASRLDAPDDGAAGEAYVAVPHRLGSLAVGHAQIGKEE
ncbi:MAG TPA: DUF2520 domain-containing protein [Dehalococcoidia bacterium]|nr:DUF2520 domain-containing protein [Dehalococcoidia bacterium]